VTERYVTARELARIMGVSTRTIERMTRDGMPSETWGMGRMRRYLPSQAMDWASGRRYRMKQVNPPGREATPPGSKRRRSTSDG
jgi:phage terminase Nu1 subunit (DNA packaging protein)